MNPETRAAVKYSIPFLLRCTAAVVAAVVLLVAAGFSPALVAIGLTLTICAILASHRP